MKVLVVATIGRTVDAFLREQIVELERRGNEVHILCAQPAPVADLAGVTTAPWTRPLPLRALIPALARTRAALRGLAPDLIYTHTAIASFLARAAAATIRPRPAVVYCAHGFSGAAAQPLVVRSVARAVERLARSVTDLLLVMNDEDEEWAARARYPDVVRIPSIGLPLDHYRAGHRRMPDHRQLVVIAELIPRKRVDLALATLAELDDRFSLVVIGDGPLRSELTAQAAKLGVSQRVTFTGQVDDVRPHLRRAWMVLSTSQQEGLARSLLEAMASGTPTAGFDARGVSDLLRDGVGLVVERADSSALAAALTRLADDPGAWAAFQAAGAEVVELHDADQIARVVVDHLERVGAH